LSHGRVRNRRRFTKAKVTAAQIGKVRAVFDPKWKDVVTKLKAAIKAKQNDKIDLTWRRSTAGSRSSTRSCARRRWRAATCARSSSTRISSPRT
jgi:hypothetical protein